MISRLKGELVEQNPPSVLIDVNGVGYEVQVPMTTLFELPQAGQQVVLHTHFVVREDAQQLYGFSTKADRSLFQTLIKVNGVGPKMALAIMSTMNASQFALAVENDEVKQLTSIPGVGKKTAERLIVEMRGKLEVSSTEGALSGLAQSATTLLNRNAAAEAEEALLALGYKPTDATKMVARASEQGDAPVEVLIKRALSEAA